MTEPAIARHIETLVARARRDRESFSPPLEPPDEERAMDYLREGFGRAVWCYVEARTDGFDQIDPGDFAALEGAMNDWLGLYARCHGVEVDPDVPVRVAAETLLSTHNVRDTARVLTHVPQRSTPAGPPKG